MHAMFLSARRAVGFTILTAFIFWFFPTTAQADARAGGAARADGLVRMGDQGMGALLLKSETPGLYIEAPTVATDVKIDVAGPIVRARVTQRFENPSDQWVEGVYVFPLPADAGVDRLKMVVGDRFIEGEIKEREEARRIYEEAKASGVKASLVEQERPNIFTNSVANIGPGETVVVQIEYQDAARLKDGVFSLRFPMVAGPRYIPEPDVIEMVSLGGAGFAFNPAVPDARRITPPVVKPEYEPEQARLPVTIEATLDAGFEVGEVASLYHPALVERLSGARVRVTLADGPVPADKDFALEWRAKDAAAPHAALFAEERDGETYVLGMIVPPAELTEDAQRRPREAIFVIDNSGSMAGRSMPQAKAALLIALERLAPDDRFNVIRFDDTYDLLFPDAVSATPENVQLAMRYVGGLEANGGTELLDPLKASLRDLSPNEPDRVRQVVFLTDGAIGNEDQLFQAIDAMLGESRLFTVGIGSAPNTYFMSRAARLGRGTFTHIGDVDEVETRAAQLYEALERPVMTNVIAVHRGGGLAEVWPDPLPDLYAGEPVIFTAKVGDFSGTLRIQGELAGSVWAADMNLGDAATGAGVSTLWARNKIASIEEGRFTGANWQDVDAGVLQTALDFSLVSRLTSLVAVDVTPARPENVRLTTAEIPTMLPDGWVFDKVFGPDVKPLDRDALNGDIRFASLKGEAAPADALAQEQGLALPQGATLWDLKIFLGVLLMMVGLLWAARILRVSPEGFRRR